MLQLRPSALGPASPLVARALCLDADGCGAMNTAASCRQPALENGRGDGAGGGVKGGVGVKGGLVVKGGGPLVAMATTPAATATAAAAAIPDPDKSTRLQACWIRLWDRWACEQRNLVLYQMHVNHALSRERSKLTLAGGRVVSCRRVKQQQHQHHHHHHHHHHNNHHQQTPAAAHGRPPAAAAAVAAVAAARTTAGGIAAVVGSSSSSSPPRPPDEQDAAGARDLRVLATAVDRLRASGWYYEGPDAQARAARALASMPAGRFCVRDSKHSEHLFTMDVQTGRPGGRHLMSVRFTYADGAFGLDSPAGGGGGGGAASQPRFRCPIELIDYYVRLSRVGAARQMSLVRHPAWTDRCSGQYVAGMNLRRPAVATDPAAFPSLRHMARLVINRHKQLIAITPTSLPNELIEYLLQYPYSL